NVHIEWEATNAAGIRSPYVTVTQEGNRVTVKAEGDGQYYLLGLCGKQEGCCDFISQIEFTALGTGKPSMDPYSYVSAGLYDLHEGNIGTGNEKGVAFDRYGESMIGFSRVDFGPTGSDTLTADIFALNDDPYDMELQACALNGGKKMKAVLHYEKPSIWNVYQSETWKLPERLTGVQTLSFRMNDKIHMKGFRFERQINAYIPHTAGSADQLYGDCYTREGSAVNNIGNNVTLTWNNMDFGGEQEITAEIHGHTPLDSNTICIRITGAHGAECNNAVEFSGKGGEVQRFRIKVPAGLCSVSFVFLPGSSFDFSSFRFYRP
ncbi:MAG: glycoside hydrolase family 2, partial [Clostridia bacterium]|nr:glycoside hydrolase family 2 [Clostridia bacterium]